MSFLPCIIALVSALPASPAGEEKDQSPTGVRLPTAPSVEIAITGEAAGLLLHDLDGDGYLDLLVAANKGGSDAPSYVFLSKEGKFQEPSWISADQDVSAGIAVGDMDNDGIEDLVLSRYNHNLSVAYRGLGKGQFETRPFWESEDTESSYGVLVADFNGDGLADILTIQRLRIYRGGKEGPSKDAGWRSRDQFAEGKTCWVDLDRDGRKDLVVTHWMGPAITLHRGLKKEFDSQPVHLIPEPGGFSGLAVGDLDGDGFPEIVVGARTDAMGDGRVRLYGNRNGRPTEKPIWLSDDVDAWTQELILHDLDRDGDLDLLVVAGKRSAAYENQKGVLAPAPCWRAAIAGGEARMADLDRNGYPDLVVGGRGKIQFYYGGPEVPLEKVEPFPSMPQLPPLGDVELLAEAPKAGQQTAGKIQALDFLGIKLSPMTPALKVRYGLEDETGAVVLSVPTGVNWRFEMGNLREGDVLLGVGSSGDDGHTVERARDPWELQKQVLAYGEEDVYHQVGVQLRCGPLHPSEKGQIREETIRILPKDWAKLSGEPAEKPEKIPMVWLQGTIVVTDPAGRSHAGELGTFTFVLWDGHMGENHPVRVDNGQWKTAIPSNVKLGISDIKLGGKDAYPELERFEQLPIPEDGKLDLKARWPAATMLRVLGEDTGADLKDISVVINRTMLTDDFSHPGNFSPKDLLLGEGQSPINLSELKKARAGAWSRTFKVHSPGYAWGKIDVDYARGGEKRLVLQRGGDAEITIFNFKPESRGLLRLWRKKPADKESDSESPDRGRMFLELEPAFIGPTRIEALEPGSYTASVEIGAWYKKPEMLGQADLEIAAGTKAAAALVLQNPVARGKPVPLEGTLFIPPAWGKERPYIGLEPVDLPDTSRSGDRREIDRVKLMPVVDHPGLHRFTAGLVVPGKYSLDVNGEEFKHQQEVTVGPQGERNVEIKIAEPIEVSLEILDAETGKPAEITSIHWSGELLGNVRGGDWKSIDRNRESGRFDFRTASESGSVDDYGETYNGSSEDLQLHPGKNRHTLSLTRACGVRIHLLDGEERLAWNWQEHQVTLKPLEGEGMRVGRGWGTDFHYMKISSPGRYLLTLKPIEGFEPVPPQEITVKQGEFTEVTLKLTRAK